MTEQTEKMYYPVKLSQDETDYESYMVRRNPVAQACANCRWFAAPMDCYLVECEPLPILPTGWCNRWEAMPKEKEEPMEIEIEIEADDMEVGMMARYDATTAPPVDALVTKRSGLLQRDKVEPCFKVLSNGLWIAHYTNNIQDSDREILKAKAHKKFVSRIKRGLVAMPELWRRHWDGTAHGKALHVDYVEDDGVLTVFAIGEFHNSAVGKAARRFYEKAKPGDISLSHGFMYPRWALKDGEYEEYNTFEISTLKRGQEANEWTSFSTKGKHMPLSETQRKDIETVFGDTAPEIIERVEQVGKTNKAIADGLSAKYKGYTDVTDTTGGTEPQDDSTAKAFGALLPTLLEDSAVQMKIIEGIDKRLDEAHKAATDSAEKAKAVASFEARLKAMEKLMEMPAQPASESASTVVNVPANPNGFTQKELEDMLGEMKAKQEIDAKKTGSSNATVEALLFGGR